MRIHSIVIQGLVAGAIMLFPSIAFADKGDLKQSERGKSAITNQNENAAKKAAPKKLSLYKPKSNVQKQVPSKHNAVKKGQKQKVVHKPVKKAVNRAPKAGRKVQPVPKQVLAERKSIKELHSIHKKRVTSKKRGSQPAPPKLKDKPVVPRDQKTAVAKINIQPAAAEKRMPVPVKSRSIPQDKAVLMQTLHTLHSASKDKENGGKPSSFMKGTLVHAEYQDVNEPLPSFFSRLALLCNQWMNAPPSEPPKIALNFLIARN